MGRSLSSAAALALTAALFPFYAPAKAKDPDVLNPATPWNVDFGDTKCRLVRAFGEEDSRHYLIFEVWGPSSHFGFTAAGPLFKRFDQKRDVSIAFGSSQAWSEGRPFLGDLGPDDPALIYTKMELTGEASPNSDSGKGISSKPLDPQEKPVLPQLDVEQAKGVDVIRFKQRGREVHFAIKQLGAAFKLMKQCAEDMITVWGLDLDQHRAMTKLPYWTNSEDVGGRIAGIYPRIALDRGEQGIMRLRVNVDETGKVTDCVVDKATKTKRLESPACKEMDRAKFEPAMDKNGDPMPSFVLIPITYRIRE